MTEIPSPPKPPPIRVLTELDPIRRKCKLCHSSLKGRWFQFLPLNGGCLSEECDNFWEKIKKQK